MRRSTVAGVVLLSVALVGCGAGQGRGVQPRDGESGLQLSGTVDGRQVAVLDGLPRLYAGDCGFYVGLPADVCFGSRDIDGGRLVLGLGNPQAVADAGTLPVRRPTCGSADECADVEDHAVVQLVVGDAPVRVDGGTLTVTELIPSVRYAGVFNLRLEDGRVSGRFDVVPRPES